MSVKLKAPKGKIRVVCIDLLNNDRCLITDCDDRDHAFRIVDGHNKDRTGPKSKIYNAFGDTGAYLRGTENVKSYDV